MSGTYTNLLYHVVFSTKLRIPLITRTLRDELHRYIGGIIRGEGGVLLEVGGMPDHVHLLTKLAPTVSLPDVLRKVKANSSKWANAKSPTGRKFGWQDGYAAFSASESQVARVTQYIRDQERHHRGVEFKEELIKLLRRHRVEYDERYLST